MPQEITEKFADVLDVSKDVPFISLIMPFEPKMGLKTELAIKLNNAADNIEKELLGKYPAEEAMPVIKKLRHVIKDMNYSIHKQSIAIFVSPLIENLYFFNYSPGNN